eukprot:gene11310-23664_t
MERGSKGRVLIVGNGIGGSKVTAVLAAMVRKNKKDVSITVLTPLNYNEVSLSMTNVVATGASEHNAIIHPLVKEDDVTYVIGSCKQLNERSVVTSDETTIEFDACVIATGLNYPIFQASPSQPTIESRKAYIANIQSEIQKASTIVLSGGGPVGCETASDIKIRNPSKRVVVVCADILTSTTESLRTLGKAAMIKQGIELILNDRVTTYEDNKITTTNGVTIENAYYIPCFAKGPNTSFVPDNMKNDKGYVIVNDFLQSNINSRVFAVSDCSSYDPVKLAIKSDDQFMTIAKNALATVEDRPLIAHKKGFFGHIDRPMIVAFGHNHPDGYGVGPDLSGFPGCLLWTCCCFGYPCSPPAGHGVSKFKSDFNKSVKMTKGQGIHA